MNSCCDNSLDPSTPPIPPTINIGSAFAIDFFLRDKAQSPWEPIDLTGSTEIVVILLNADNTFLELKLSLSQVLIVNAKDGHFQAKGTSVQSALLKMSGINASPVATPNYSDIQARITPASGLAADNLVVLFPQSVNLVPQLFPTAP